MLRCVSSGNQEPRWPGARSRLRPPARWPGEERLRRIPSPGSHAPHARAVRQAELSRAQGRRRQPGIAPESSKLETQHAKRNKNRPRASDSCISTAAARRQPAVRLAAHWITAAMASSRPAALSQATRSSQPMRSSQPIASSQPTDSAQLPISSHRRSSSRHRSPWDRRIPWRRRIAWHGRRPLHRRSPWDTRSPWPRRVPWQSSWHRRNGITMARGISLPSLGVTRACLTLVVFGPVTNR